MSNDYYNYEKMFIDLMGRLNGCQTKKSLMLFDIKDANELGQKGAPHYMINYIDASIENKKHVLEIRDNLDMGKLRAIAEKNS